MSSLNEFAGRILPELHDFMLAQNDELTILYQKVEAPDQRIPIALKALIIPK